MDPRIGEKVITINQAIERKNELFTRYKENVSKVIFIVSKLIMIIRILNRRPQPPNPPPRPPQAPNTVQVDQVLGILDNIIRQLNLPDGSPTQVDIENLLNSINEAKVFVRTLNDQNPPNNELRGHIQEIDRVVPNVAPPPRGPPRGGGKRRKIKSLKEKKRRRKRGTFKRRMHTMNAGWTIPQDNK